MADFDDIKVTFWHRDQAPEPPASPAAVARAEAELGVTLPRSFVELLEIRNGGVVADELDSFPIRQATSGAEDYVPLPDMMGAVLPTDTGMSIMDTPYLVEEWGLPSPIVLLSGDGHHWIGLDYRDCGPHGEPSVCWFDADHETDLLLAPDFRSFVEGLRPSPPSED